MRAIDLSLPLPLSLPLILLCAVACSRPKIELEPLETSATDPSDSSTGTGDDSWASASATSTTTADETETETGPSDPDVDTGPGPTGPETDFVPNADDGWDADLCDPFAQDCPEGEKCVPYESTGDTFDENKCVPIVGDGAAGDACVYAGPLEATDDCDGDNMCWYVEDVDGQLLGTCVPFCTDSPMDPACPADSTCYLANSGVIAICLPDCDPLTQDCGAGQGCHYSEFGFMCMLDDDSVALGEPCDAFDACAPGLGCLDAGMVPGCGGAACCTPYCDLLIGDQDCAALPGTSCVPFFAPDPPPVGYEQVGICAS